MIDLSWAPPCPFVVSSRSFFFNFLFLKFYVCECFTQKTHVCSAGGGQKGALGYLGLDLQKAVRLCVNAGTRNGSPKTAAISTAPVPHLLRKFTWAPSAIFLSSGPECVWEEIIVFVALGYCQHTFIPLVPKAGRQVGTPADGVLLCLSLRRQAGRHPCRWCPPSERLSKLKPVCFICFQSFPGKITDNYCLNYSGLFLGLFIWR